jgi:hypothetical protein
MLAMADNNQLRVVRQSLASSISALMPSVTAAPHSPNVATLAAVVIGFSMAAVKQAEVISLAREVTPAPRGPNMSEANREHQEFEP